jgi:uncharacterized protein YdaU (DUF1376 family)
MGGGVNYYPFHLGDYAAHTAHLDLLEDLAYRRMLDLYYRTERPLPEPAEIARLIRMRDHAATIRDVLNEFFEQSPEGYRHARCDEEIERMQDKQAKARASAAASVAARSTSAQRTLNERSTNAELPTPTPTPTPEEKKEARKRAAPLARPFEVDGAVWDDWLALRKAKRAPVSRTVVAEAEREAGKAGLTLEAFLRVWCARGSQGLQAEWLKPAERGQGPPAEPAWRTEQRARNEAFLGPAAASRRQQPQRFEVIDADAKALG